MSFVTLNCQLSKHSRPPVRMQTPNLRLRSLTHRHTDHTVPICKHTNYLRAAWGLGETAASLS